MLNTPPSSEHGASLTDSSVFDDKIPQRCAYNFVDGVDGTPQAVVDSNDNGSLIASSTASSPRRDFRHVLAMSANSGGSGNVPGSPLAGCEQIVAAHDESLRHTANFGVKNGEVTRQQRDHRHDDGRHIEEDDEEQEEDRDGNGRGVDGQVMTRSYLTSCDRAGDMAVPCGVGIHAETSSHLVLPVSNHMYGVERASMVPPPIDLSRYRPSRHNLAHVSRGCSAEVTVPQVVWSTCGHSVHYSCLSGDMRPECPLCRHRFNAFIPLVPSACQVPRREVAGHAASGDADEEEAECLESIPVPADVAVEGSIKRLYGVDDRKRVSVVRRSVNDVAGGGSAVSVYDHIRRFTRDIMACKGSLFVGRTAGRFPRYSVARSGLQRVVRDFSQSVYAHGEEVVLNWRCIWSHVRYLERFARIFPTMSCCVDSVSLGFLTSQLRPPLPPRRCTVRIMLPGESVTFVPASVSWDQGDDTEVGTSSQEIVAHDFASGSSWLRPHVCLLRVLIQAIASVYGGRDAEQVLGLDQASVSQPFLLPDDASEMDNYFEGLHQLGTVPFHALSPPTMTGVALYSYWLSKIGPMPVACGRDLAVGANMALAAALVRARIMALVWIRRLCVGAAVCGHNMFRPAGSMFHLSVNDRGVWESFIGVLEHVAEHLEDMGGLMSKQESKAMVDACMGWFVVDNGEVMDASSVWLGVSAFFAIVSSRLVEFTRYAMHEWGYSRETAVALWPSSVFVSQLCAEGIICAFVSEEVRSLVLLHAAACGLRMPRGATLRQSYPTDGSFLSLFMGRDVEDRGRDTVTERDMGDDAAAAAVVGDLGTEEDAGSRQSRRRPSGVDVSSPIFGASADGGVGRGQSGECLGSGAMNGGGSGALAASLQPGRSRQPAEDSTVLSTLLTGCLADATLDDRRVASDVAFGSSADAGVGRENVAGEAPAWDDGQRAVIREVAHMSEDARAVAELQMRVDEVPGLICWLLRLSRSRSIRKRSDMVAEAMQSSRPGAASGFTPEYGAAFVRNVERRFTCAFYAPGC